MGKCSSDLKKSQANKSNSQISKMELYTEKDVSPLIKITKLAEEAKEVDSNQDPKSKSDPANFFS
jgi:hypothetical protein